MWLIFIPSWTYLDYQILSYECQTTFWRVPGGFHPPTLALLNIPFQNKHRSQPPRYWCRHHNLDSRESSCQNRPPPTAGDSFCKPPPFPLSFSSFGDPGPCIKSYSLWGPEADCVIDFWNGRNENKTRKLRIIHLIEKKPLWLISELWNCMMAYLFPG